MTELQAARRCHWVNHLARHAHEQPDAVAFRFGGHSVTWRELEVRVGLLADAFARRGVGHGDRVLLLLTNRLEFVEAMFAANRLGAIAVPVNFRLSPAELTYIIGDSDPRIIVVEQLLAAAVNLRPFVASSWATIPRPPGRAPSGGRTCWTKSASRIPSSTWPRTTRH